jgi:hypothetical protein
MRNPRLLAITLVLSLVTPACASQVDAPANDAPPVASSVRPAGTAPGGTSVGTGAVRSPKPHLQSSVMGSGAVCVPSCEHRQCGDDGCGGKCGVCQPDQTCNTSGQCEGGSTTGYAGPGTGDTGSSDSGGTPWTDPGSIGGSTDTGAGVIDTGSNDTGSSGSSSDTGSSDTGSTDSGSSDGSSTDSGTSSGDCGDTSGDPSSDPNAGGASTGGDTGGDTGTDPSSDPGTDSGSDPSTDPGTDPSTDPGTDTTDPGTCDGCLRLPPKRPVHVVRSGHRICTRPVVSR